MMCYFLCQYKRGIIKRQLPIYLLTYTDSAVLNVFYCIQEISHIIIFPLKELNKFAVTDNKQILFVTEYELVFDVQQSLCLRRGAVMETLQELVSFKGFSCLCTKTWRLTHPISQNLGKNTFVKWNASIGDPNTIHTNLISILMMFPLKLNFVLLSVQKVKTILKAYLKQMCTCKSVYCVYVRKH